MRHREPNSQIWIYPTWLCGIRDPFNLKPNQGLRFLVWRSFADPETPTLMLVLIIDLINITLSLSFNVVLHRCLKERKNHVLIVF